jgi:DNA modification methylase
MEWHGCYDQGWKGLITDESFAHPAKFARGLVERIYDYLLSTGRLVRGNTVVDPFGGVGLGGVIGASKGLRWFGCELESRFVGLAEGNFALHRALWEAAGDPLPRIVNGDSRGLSDVLGPALAEAVVGSPPFSGTEQPCASQTRAKKDYHAFTRGNGTKRDAVMTGDTPGQLGSMPTGDVDAVLSSPPYSSGTIHDGGIDPKAFADPGRAGGNCQATTMKEYGQTPGQLGAMPAGTVDGILSSPPYAEQVIQGGGANAYGAKKEHDRTGVWPKGNLARTARAGEGYGNAEGQLGNLPAGSVADAVVSSPPYEEGLGHGGTKPIPILVEKKLHSALANNGYGGGPGNISNLAGQTFWQASRLIVLQCKLLLKPGGTAVWVVKDFVRSKKRVPFSDDWRKLCEACGFRLVEWIKASLVSETVTATMFEGNVTRRRERKSFFRRLAEKKGSPRIDHEDVLVMERIR